MSPWTLYFDGLCEPKNPGGWMSFGWALDLGAGGMLTGKGAFEPDPGNTNNIAEYLALYYGIQAVQARRDQGDPYAGVVIKGDSQLVCKQINDEWEVKVERLRDAHGRCLKMLLGLTPWMAEWIPREQNQLADKLSKDAYTNATGLQAPERGKRRAS